VAASLSFTVAYITCVLTGLAHMLIFSGPT